MSVPHNDLKLLLYLDFGIALGNKLINSTGRSFSERLYLSSKIKKIINLIQCKKKNKNNVTNYFAPIITFSNHNLWNQERQQLKLGLVYCFGNKNKDIFRDF